jgi:NaMN:DMB phosphoribosyltransferase
MLAVAACVKALDPSRITTVATTKYVAADPTSTFSELASELGIKTYIAPLDFSSSPHKGLSDYERGFVKEGVGAGGSVLYASRSGVSVERIIARTNEIYRDTGTKAD